MCGRWGWTKRGWPASPCCFQCSRPLTSGGQLLLCRYGALKTLGEKKTAFNEYVQARKKEEAEEARQRRMKVRAGWYSGQRCCTQAGGSHVQALQLGARARGCCWQPCARC